MRRGRAFLRAAIGLAVLMCCVAALARSDTGKRDYATDLEFTVPTQYEVVMGNGTQTLRRMKKLWDDDAYIDGAYHNPFGLTGGETLYLFPDHRFLWTTGCDVCGPQKVIAEGTWSKHENRVALTLEKDKFADEWPGLRKDFHLLSDLAAFIVAGGEHIGHTVLVPASQLKPGVVESSIERFSPYVDWQKVYQDLMAH